MDSNSTGQLEPCQRDKQGWAVARMERTMDLKTEDPVVHPPRYLYEPVCVYLTTRTQRPALALVPYVHFYKEPMKQA